MWPELCTSQDAPTLKFFKEKHHMYTEYFIVSDSHNPTAYLNMYRKAPLPRFVLSNSGYFIRMNVQEEVLRLHVLNGLTHNLAKDYAYIKTFLSHPSYYDPLKECKENITNLHRTLAKAYLLHELWGMNKKLKENV